MDEFKKVRQESRLLLETIRGSHLYGLNTPESDIDTYGVYIGEKSWFFDMNWDKRDCIRDEKQDNSWSEVGKYINELSRSNPDALVSLFTPDNLILHRHSVMSELFEMKDLLLTKECFKPFASYSVEQIKKAKGLNKASQIDPEEVKVRKSLLDYCYVTERAKTIPLTDWLEINQLDQTLCGLVKMPHLVDVFALFYDPTNTLGYKGLIKEGATDLRLSSIPKSEAITGFRCNFHMKRSEFSKHCVKHKQYWDWVKNRNQSRYELNKGYNFDSKNMCHCVRILTMASEIARGEGMKLDRTNIDREFLLDIKNHKLTYDEIMKFVTDLESKMLSDFENSKLPESPDINRLNKVLSNIREQFYYGR